MDDVQQRPPAGFAPVALWFRWYVYLPRSHHDDDVWRHFTIHLVLKNERHLGWAVKYFPRLNHKSSFFQLLEKAGLPAGENGQLPRNLRVSWLLVIWLHTQYQLSPVLVCNLVLFSYWEAPMSKSGLNTFIILVYIVLSWCIFQSCFIKLLDTNWYTENLSQVIFQWRSTGWFLGAKYNEAAIYSPRYHTKACNRLSTRG